MPAIKCHFSLMMVIGIVAILLQVQCQGQQGITSPNATAMPTAFGRPASLTPLNAPLPLITETLPPPPASVTPIALTALPQPLLTATDHLVTPTGTTPNEGGAVVRDLGLSTNGYPIQAFQLGSGSRHLMIVSGVHGGYEWNSILLAYALWDYFADQPSRLPANVRLTVLPALNLDGQVAVAGTPARFTPADVSAETTVGRFNGNRVDLNRNWPCDWQPSGVWRQQTVSGGSEPFSEIENQHLNYFIAQDRPDLVIFLHSALPGIIISSCNGQEVEAGRALANLYAIGSGYPLYDTFAAYDVTGDAGDYLATIGIAAFTIEMTDHIDIEFDRNVNGVLQVMTALANAAD